MTSGGAFKRRRQGTNPATGRPVEKISCPVRSAQSRTISLDFSGAADSAFGCSMPGSGGLSEFPLDPHPAATRAIPKTQMPVLTRVDRSVRVLELLADRAIAIAVLVPPVLGVDVLDVGAVAGGGRVGACVEPWVRLLASSPTRGVWHLGLLDGR